METQSNAFLGTEKVSRLMRKFALPCVISLLVGALYNIVDQIYIANASYLGSYGNAANTVVFPLTVIALAIATMLGDGCCAFVSLSLGAQNQQDAHKGVGTAIVALIASSLALTAIYLIFLEPIVTMFGARVNEETFRLSKEYFFSPWACRFTCSARRLTPSSARTAARSSPCSPCWQARLQTAFWTRLQSSFCTGA